MENNTKFQHKLVKCLISPSGVKTEYYFRSILIFITKILTLLFWLFCSLENFAGKTNDLDDLDQSLVSDLSKVETYLLKSQEMMMVRGKVSYLLCEPYHCYYMVLLYNNEF